MKHTAILASLIAIPSLAADYTAWQFTQSLDVTEGGLHSIVLPPETLNASRPALEDPRVISPAGVETPFVIEWPEIKPARLVDPARFDMSLGDGVTELRISTGTTEPIRAIHLRPAAAKFLKSLRIETSADGVNWQEFVSNGIIFREPYSAESTTIKLPPQSHGHLRVIVNDKDSAAIAFTSPRLELQASEAETAPLKATLRKTEALVGKTRLTVDLGGKNVFIASLQLDTADPVFSRRVVVSMPGDGGPDLRSRNVATTTVFRIALGTQTSSSLEIPIHQSIASDTLLIEIDNGDSPPLKIADVQVVQHPVQVWVHAGETGQWQVISGNPLAVAPRYDIAAIKTQLTTAPAKRLALGALTSSDQFKTPTALPEVDAKGINVDVALCRYRRPVEIRSPGVIAIELSAEVLAHCQLSRGDIRLVQRGEQLPFVVDYESGPWVRFVEATTTATTDEKRPSVTRWTVTLPVDSLPANRLSCTSPTPLFDRQISASATTKDSYGNDTRTHLGRARWSQKPGDYAREFELRFARDRVPGVFELETDNGDNPPIQLQRVRVHYPTVRLIAKVADASPAFLYYGNDRAVQPQYDLQLVRAELMSAPRESATLGAEEQLIVSRKDERTSSTGSPWLWLALAAVVGVLLWVVAKMLPKSADEQGKA